jgi:ribonuclease HII
MAYVIGIDEVGRGALAGPVMVCALALPKGWRAPKRFGVLRDSKQLSSGQREEWNNYFANHSGIRFTLARVYPRMIEKLNIASATNLAAERAFVRLARDEELDIARVMLDGRLYLGKNRGDVYQELSIRTIPKGDERVPAIAAASIVAKVARDAFMTRLHSTYPQYGFALHKGYGTVMHRRAIKQHGRSLVHRVTFC